MAYQHKIIVFTDIHITAEGDTIIGLDPMARFREGLTHALNRHGDAARIVILGDLTHSGQPEQYARLRDLLADCPIPVSLMIGNHDRRQAFIDAFPDAPRSRSGFVQSFVDLEGWRLVMLDTVDEDAPDHHSGLMCEARLQWMEDALSAAEKSKRIVFTHHPTFETGFTGMDDIGLRNRNVVLRRLKRHPNVRLIVSGHVHRTIFGAAGNIPAAVFKSPCHQMPMLLGEAGSTHSVDEPGAYGILLLNTEGVVVHTEDFALSDGTSLTY